MTGRKTLFSSFYQVARLQLKCVNRRTQCISYKIEIYRKFCFTIIFFFSRTRSVSRHGSARVSASPRGCYSRVGQSVRDSSSTINVDRIREWCSCVDGILIGTQKTNCIKKHCGRVCPKNSDRDKLQKLLKCFEMNYAQSLHTVISSRSSLLGVLVHSVRLALVMIVIRFGLSIRHTVLSLGSCSSIGRYGVSRE